MSSTRRRLVVLRHAKSDWSGDQSDAQRPLAPRGRRQAPRTGEWLARTMGVPDLAVVSPAVRARETWDLVADRLPRAVALVVDDRVYAATRTTLEGVVRDLPVEISSVVLVGHNPGLEELVTALTGERVRLVTAAVADISVRGPWAHVGPHATRLLFTGRPTGEEHRPVE